MTHGYVISTILPRPHISLLTPRIIDKCTKKRQFQVVNKIRKSHILQNVVACYIERSVCIENRTARQREKRSRSSRDSLKNPSSGIARGCYDRLAASILPIDWN